MSSSRCFLTVERMPLVAKVRADEEPILRAFCLCKWAGPCSVHVRPEIEATYQTFHPSFRRLFPRSPHKYWLLTPITLSMVLELQPFLTIYADQISFPDPSPLAILG